MSWPACSSTPIWPSAAPAPAASVSWPSAAPRVLVPFPQAADRHQDANAAAAVAAGGAVIVAQHPPGQGPLAQTLWQLLGPKLRGGAAAADPLLSLRNGMERLAVRDADQRLALLLQELV